MNNLNVGQIIEMAFAFISRLIGYAFILIIFAALATFIIKRDENLQKLFFG
mgnify:CR=1 FL=1